MAGNPLGAERTLGRAEFALALERVRVEPGETLPLRLWSLDHDGGFHYGAVVEAETFRLPGLGMDEALWFTVPVGSEETPLWAAGEASFGSLLVPLVRCSHRELAVLEAIKFALRIPEAGRAEAFARMRAFGERRRRET